MYSCLRYFLLIDLFSSPTISTTFDSLICFQEKLANGPFLQEKVKECFKDNPHCLTLVMNPDVSTALVALYQLTLSLIKPARILTYSLTHSERISTNDIAVMLSSYCFGKCVFQLIHWKRMFLWVGNIYTLIDVHKIKTGEKNLISIFSPDIFISLYGWSVFQWYKFHQ